MSISSIAGNLSRETLNREVQMKDSMVEVVTYKEKYFIHYKTNSSGLAQLIDDEGKKFSGTPSPAKLKFIKSLVCRLFNEHWYFSTKIGIFSKSTGNIITDRNIIKLFV